MTRLPIALAALCIWAACSAAAPLRAQPAPPVSSTPAPQPASPPTPSAAPAHHRRFNIDRFYKGGDTYYAADISVSPGIGNEFHPSAAQGAPSSFSAWTIGEAIILRKIKFVTTTDFRSYVYRHTQRDAAALCPNASEPGCVTVVGNSRSQTNVAAFNARETELENVYAIEVPLGFYLGAARMSKFNDYGYSSLSGFGYGIGRMPRMAERVSPYFNLISYSNLGGNVATPAGKVGISYRGVHYRAGMVFGVGPRFFVDAGTIGTRLRSRADAPADIHETAGYAGIGYRY